MSKKEKQLNFPFHPDEIRKLRKELARELAIQEAPEMRRILDAGHLSTEDYTTCVNI